MLWDMANTNPNLSVLSVLHSKHDLEYHNTAIGRCLLKGNIHFYINHGSEWKKKIKKSRGRNLNLKKTYGNSLSNQEVQFHWTIHNSILKSKMSICSEAIKNTLSFCSMGKWTWKHFTVLLFQIFHSVALHIWILNCSHLNPQWFPKYKGIFVNIFPAWDHQTLIPPVPSCICVALQLI